MIRGLITRRFLKVAVALRATVFLGLPESAARRSAATLSATAAILLMLGAARLAATEIDLPVFAGGYGLSFYEETARRFEALRPGVKVHLYGDPRIGDKIAPAPAFRYSAETYFA